VSTAKKRPGPAPPRLPELRPGKKGGKRDENRRRRIRQICDAALPLLLEQGVAAVTIDQIVAGAGIAKGSFYRYFKDKAELVETLFEPLATGMRAAFDACAEALDEDVEPTELPAIYLRLAAQLATFIGDRPDLLRLYLQENRSPAVGARAPIRHLADEIAERGVALSAKARDFGLLDDSDPRIGALTVIGATERLLFAFLQGDELGPPADVPRVLIQMILDGVRRR
jgi:AcrR family transcriptional regulator